ncbi:arsenate reductase (glutaredoxin) [Sphingobacterium sp.]|uniref:arsenate reductase (glutaredoxin) n=1 Tax=Sphingobacterium sp. TaxID=341027 RepID=UPI0028ABDB75|nr:arsenate reductase (glutaredoxin) [Sphingobacterium sp.]
MIKIYHNINCSKSCSVLEQLEQQSAEFEIQEYLNDVPTKAQLVELLGQLGLTPMELIRKGESVFQEKFQNLELTDEQWIDVLLAYPILIERPIVVRDGVAVIGRPIEKVVELIGGKS